MDLFVGRKWRLVLARRYVSPGRLCPLQLFAQGFDLVGDCIYRLFAGALLEAWLLSSSWSWLKGLSWSLHAMSEHGGCVALLPKVSEDTLTSPIQTAFHSPIQNWFL
jgi:hypothetical protein